VKNGACSAQSSFCGGAFEALEERYSDFFCPFT
jgi:hypothetical protein